MSQFKLAELAALATPPGACSSEWLAGAEQSVAYLKANDSRDEIVLYASGESLLIHGVLALTSKVTPPDTADLQYQNPPMLDDSWCIQKVWGGGQGHRMYLEPPLSASSKSFAGGEKLIFVRPFRGLNSVPAPIELSQKLLHSLCLYWVPERQAYCRLDARGDIEDVIRILAADGANRRQRLQVVTILRKDLDTYMALSGTCLVLRFDFTRVSDTFGGWSQQSQYQRDDLDLFYHGGFGGGGSYCSGAMVIRPRVSVEDLEKAWQDEEDPESRQYASFKIFDRKHGRNLETSCAPQCLANYFEDSDMPWEVSPAFFRAEVLLRFKSDPEKYDLAERSISCRNAWHLKSYDINEAGQVHCYIGDLANLPYEEQLYWQAYNEWPKGPISVRAHQTDIEGSWDIQENPLAALKRLIGVLDDSAPAWWKARGATLADAVRYPVTDSVKEWGDEVLALDQYLVEGFLVKPLRQLAAAGGRVVEPNWGSLRVLQEVLVASGADEATAKSLVFPMQRLHALRTEVRGHATAEKRDAAIFEARRTHGSLRAHFEQLAYDCEYSMRAIVEMLHGQRNRE